MTECIPIEDIKEHEEGSTCSCLPKVIFHNGEMIIVHMAFDGRHLIEQVNEILNNEQTASKGWLVKKH